MATNKLMEAAADILSGSKKSAPAMPPQKLEGEVVDLGGPTPQNSKPDDDSNKIDATKAAKSATAPTTKPSAASGKVVDSLKKEDSEVYSDEVIGEVENDYDPEMEEFITEEEFMQLDELSQVTLSKYFNKRRKKLNTKQDRKNLERSQDRMVAFDYGTDYNRKKAKGVLKTYAKQGADYRKEVSAAEKAHQANLKKIRQQHGAMKEEIEQIEDVSFQNDINALFADDSTISEEFKSKAATIFEARVFDRVNQIQEQLESQYASMLEETVESVKNELTEKVDDYLNYVVEQWLSDNEIAIESGLRAELTEEFIAGLRNLFAEHYIDVPAEKVDLVDELAGKVEELEAKLNEEIERGMEFKKALLESRKQEITREVCEGLTETQVEKIKALAESVEFSTEEEYQSKLETIRENYFPSGVKKADETQLHEQVEDSAEKVVSNDPYVSAVARAISKTKI